MTTTAEVLARLSSTAAGQWGLITAAQADRVGITRSQLNRLAAAGVLERIEQGVYATTSSTDVNRALHSAWLALVPTLTAEERLADPGVTGVISHTSAARLHGVGDLLDDVPEVNYPTRKQTRRDIRLHRADVPAADISLVDGLPTTTVERTVADLLVDGHDHEHVAQIIGQGVRQGSISLPALAERLDPLARRFGDSDGHSLVARLLELVGLSPAALARDLARTEPGRELLVAGRATAIAEMLEALRPTLAAAKPIDTAFLDSEGLSSIAVLEKNLGSILAAVARAMSPLTEAMGQLQAPALTAATEAMRSALVATQASLPYGRHPAAPGSKLASSSPDRAEEGA